MKITKKELRNIVQSEINLVLRALDRMFKTQNNNRNILLRIQKSVVDAKEIPRDLPRKSLPVPPETEDWPDSIDSDVDDRSDENVD